MYLGQYVNLLLAFKYTFLKTKDFLASLYWYLFNRSVLVDTLQEMGDSGVMFETVFEVDFNF